MAFKFVVLCATLAMASAGIITEPSYTSYASPVVSKTLVQPAVAYAAPAHSSSYTKTLSYTAPKAYSVAASPAIATYSHYEPEHHHYAAAPVASVAYHHEPVVAKTVAYQPHYEHGHSEQNIVRSAHGTVSQISKAVDTPTSSVRKYDTRIINDGSIKTVSYAQPTAYVAQPAHTYVQPAQTYIQKSAVVSQPAVYAQHAAPVAYAQHQPTVYAQHSAPSVYAQHSAPAVYAQHSAPAVYAQHSSPVTYAQHAPVLATKLHYSPAVEVAHVNFESPLAHYGW